MKLRIKGNSLRLRLGPSEVQQLLDSGRVAETIRFAVEESAVLTYALELVPSAQSLSLLYRPHEVTVLLSREQARSWSSTDQVSISGQIDIGNGTLELLVEKDFACIDRSDPGSEDAFPNPKAGAVC